MSVRVKVELSESVYRTYLARARSLGMEDVSELVAEMLNRPFTPLHTGHPPFVIPERLRVIEQLRRQGYTWRQVGAHLGISGSVACRYWKRALEQAEAEARLVGLGVSSAAARTLAVEVERRRKR